MAQRGARRQASSAEKSTERKTIKVDSFSIVRAREWDDGGVTADIEINGITIYGCKYVYWKKDEKEGEFISFPQRKGKGKDGKETYYHIAYAPLSDEDMEKIVKAVFDKLNEK